MKLKQLLALALVGSLLFTACGVKKEDVTQLEEVKKVTVETKIVNPEVIKNSLTYAGKINAKTSVMVASKMSGKVENTFFEIGDEVKEGDVLLTLSKDDINNQIRQLEAAVNQANQGVKSAQNQVSNVKGGQYTSTVNQLETGVESAKTGVENARVTMNTAKLALDNAQTSFNSTQVLYDSGTVSKTAYDQAKLGLDQAQSGYEQASLAFEQANNSLNQAQSSLGLTTNDITNDNLKNAQIGVASAQAAVQSASVQLEIAKSQLKDTSITSPISGVISAKNAKKDEYTSPQAPAYTVVDMKSVTVDVKVSEQIINNLTKGLEVNVNIPTLGETPFNGKIETIAPAADATNTYPVSILLSNEDGNIKPGMFANVSFIKDESKNAFVLPRNAVISDGEVYYVFKVVDGKAVKTIVTVGIDNGELIEIKSGISNSDEIVVKGQSYLADSDEVNIVSKGE